MKTKNSPNLPSSKSITRKEMADYLGINRRTLLRWIKKHELDISPGLLTFAEQQAILDCMRSKC